MAKDDEAARKARAEKLRKQIARLTNQQGDTAKNTSDETEPSQDPALQENSQVRPPSSENPREFIHKRMKELDKEDE